VDGAITSYPPNKTTFDRSLVSILRIIQNYPLSPRIGLRINLDTRYIIHKAHEEDEPRRLVEERIWEARPSIDFTFITVGGIELFGGAMYRYIPEYKRETTSVSFEETSSFGELGYAAPRAGLIKRGGSFVGGAYFQGTGSDERSVHKEASDGSVIETSQELYSPTEIGIYARFDISGYVADAEFDAVQASEGSPKSEDGTGMYEDYIRVKLGLLIPYQRNELSFHTALTHRTLSYSDNAFMSLETIPLSSLHLKMIKGSADRHLFAGIIYAYGTDTQSLPEFNQKFVINSYGAKLGFNFRF
jgi:hypothetical protein